MDISVIIVSYNVKEYIISCIESIYKHSKSNYNFEIIVVDNNSKDESVNSIKKEFPEISFIKNDYNAGFSKAVNQGAKISKGKFLFILNPDTLFIEDSLFKILNEAQNKEKLGAIGPALISLNEKTQQSFSFAIQSVLLISSSLQTPPVGLEAELIIIPLVLLLIEFSKISKSGSYCLLGIVGTITGFAPVIETKSGKS